MHERARTCTNVHKRARTYVNDYKRPVLRFSRPSLITTHPKAVRAIQAKQIRSSGIIWLLTQKGCRFRQINFTHGAKCKVFRKSGKFTYKYDNTCYLYIILSYLILSYIGDERAQTCTNVHKRARTCTNVHKRARTYVNDYERPVCRCKRKCKRKRKRNSRK